MQLRAAHLKCCMKKDAIQNIRKCMLLDSIFRISVLLNKEMKILGRLSPSVFPYPLNHFVYDIVHSHFTGILQISIFLYEV